tara:strand:+ start:5375 stop:5956 length:582 start_codon:yes stop_codon:yes gene_type:complete
MKIKSLNDQRGIKFEGLFLVTPNKYKDQRGSFYESWNKNIFDKKINSCVNFVQDNHSSSIQGVLRGLHYQTSPNPQGKLVRCPYGEIFDVAVDLRINSKTFGRWTGIYLNSENMNQLWIPEGFAHGFLTISDFAEVLYKTTAYWNKECEKSIKWNDERLSIDWPLEKTKQNHPLLSKKDSESISFEDSIKYFN